MPRRLLIMGAAGRDFHNFNLLCRGRDDLRVVAFTASQIPQIDQRRYPAELAGPGYADGIPILAESELETLIRRERVDQVLFSYSDIAHAELMHRASRVLACGADFVLASPRQTMLRSARPVVAVCAVRTGCGKSATARAVARLLQARGLRPVVVRHPMPYGDLLRQRAQRLASEADLRRHQCTIEEREEYEPWIALGLPVFAGVDYAALLAEAEGEGDVILWDGGNNDTPFYRPDIHLVLTDPHRLGHETGYHPGETNLRLADILVLQKADSAPVAAVRTLAANLHRLCPDTPIVRAGLALTIAREGLLAGKRVAVVEDGPTLTHGEMAFGAGMLAARQAGVAEVVDPRPYLRGAMAAVYDQYPHLQRALPAMGYDAEQIASLRQTLAAMPCDLVLAATPIDLERLLRLPVPILRVSYDYSDQGAPTLAEVLAPRLDALAPGGCS